MMKYFLRNKIEDGNIFLALSLSKICTVQKQYVSLSIVLLHLHQYCFAFVFQHLIFTIRIIIFLNNGSSSTPRSHLELDPGASLK